MKLKSKIILSALSLSLLTVSCTEGFDSENDNPNNETSVPTYGIYNNATKNVVGTAIRGSFGSARMALPWIQYSAQSAYTEEDRYLYRPTTPYSIFTAYYAQANNFKKIIQLNTDPLTQAQVATYGSNTNQIAASRIMLAYIFQNLTDTFGDVPYWSYGNQDPEFQALNTNILNPVYATQEKIYTDLLKELEEAANMIDLTDKIFYDDQSYITENIFNNNPEKLKKFANSLRLRIATRLKNSPLSALANTHIASAIAGGVMTSNDDSVGVKFENNSINPAPQYSAFFIDNRTDYSASKTFVDLLKGQLPGTNIPATGDPRLQKIIAPVSTSKSAALAGNYTESTNLNDYHGIPFGIPSSLIETQVSENDVRIYSLYSKNVFKPDYTEYYMEYAEVEFLLAEANGWDQGNYENGVRASLLKWEVNPANITSYIAALPPANQENVMNQKYIALFMQPYEAWAEYRRTGFPTFIIKPGDQVLLNRPINGNNTYTFEPIPNITVVPTRVKYPVEEQRLNPSGYQAAAARIGGDNLDTRLIWDNN